MQVSQEHRWYVKLGACEWWLGSTEPRRVLATRAAGMVTQGQQRGCRGPALMDDSHCRGRCRHIRRPRLKWGSELKNPPVFPLAVVQGFSALNACWKHPRISKTTVMPRPHPEVQMERIWAGLPQGVESSTVIVMWGQGRELLLWEGQRVLSGTEDSQGQVPPGKGPLSPARTVQSFLLPAVTTSGCRAQACVKGWDVDLNKTSPRPSRYLEESDSYLGRQ